jgi:protein-disulfide isomerase/uncharacterized membrane protein
MMHKVHRFALHSFRSKLVCFPLNRPPSEPLKPVHTTPQPRDSSQPAAKRPRTAPIAPVSNQKSQLLFWLGLLTSLGACILCLLLLLASHASLALPGCGDASPCDQASKSVWGRVPLLDISVAGVGLAYFGACTLAWGASRGTFSTAHRAVVTLGVLVSAMYVVVMLSEKLLCAYCLATHLLNFAFFLCVWLHHKALVAPPHPRQPRLASIVALATFLAGFAGVYAFDSNSRKHASARNERELARSVQDITNASSPAASAQAASPPAATPAQAPAQSSAPAQPAAITALTGRHIWGNANAGIRIVMFTDYQCPDCKLLEAQLVRLMQTPGIKDDLAVAVRHYPISTLCNTFVTQDRHPDACYAAFASETAGLLGGRDAFWKMHLWLFDKAGSFTREALAAQVRSMQLDEALFFRTLESPPIKALITEDTTLAQRMGIAFTPMIFINGVELRGYTAPDALVRAVTALAATKPAKAALGSDVALSARERALDEFAKSLPRTLPQRFARRSLGPNDADLSVVVVGDYAEPGTREADTLLRIFTGGQGDKIRYTFVHFPVNQACNPHVPFTKHDKACVAARFVEAIGVLSGESAFWRAHDWLMQQGTIEALSPDTAASAAPTFIDPASGSEPPTKDLLTSAMAQPFIDEQIALDAKAALDAGVSSLPAIFINGRLVKTWKVENENLLPAMFTLERERIKKP